MGWIPSSATNVILNWPERIKTQPHDDRDNCFLPFDSKGPCGMTVNNDIADDSATKHSDSHMDSKPVLGMVPRAPRLLCDRSSCDRCWLEKGRKLEPSDPVSSETQLRTVSLHSLPRKRLQPVSETGCGYRFRAPITFVASLQH